MDKNKLTNSTVASSIDFLKEIQTKLDLTNLETYKRYRSLSELLDAKKTKEIQKSQVMQALEDSIKQQIFDYGKSQYLLMEKKDNFSDAGEQRVAISFCRSLLEIPASREVTQTDANLFRELISEYDQKQNNPSIAKLERQLKEFKIKIFDFEYDYTEADALNQKLAFFGLEKKVIVSSSEGFQSFIFGKTMTLENYHKKYMDKEVNLILTEEARTPYLILSMAASSGPKGANIRYASCETIFYNKWHSYFETSDFEKDLLLSHDYSNIRESIKKVAFETYGVKNLNELTAQKKLFVDEMVEGIVWHELGHEISLFNNPLINKITSALGAAMGSFGTNAVTVLKEVLADWAPEHNGIAGPVWSLAKLSETDYQKAKRMIYVYLSDYWFLDFGEEFMGETTDIVVPLITQFINEAGEIDFQKIMKVHGDIFKFSSKKYAEGVEEAKKVIQQAKFKINATTQVSYDVIENELIKQYREDPKLTNETKEFIMGFPAFWTNIIGYLQKLAPEDYLKFKDSLKTNTDAFNAELLKRLVGSKSEKEQSKLRDYVINRMKLIGCFESEKTMTEDALFESIFDELKVAEELRPKVLSRVESLKEGKDKIEVAINYEAKPNLFIAVIQKLMLMCDYGEIKSGMSLGENLSEDLPEAQKIGELHKLVAGVKKQISEKMYEKIALIKFNTDYLSEEIYQNEFKAVAPKGSFDLTPLVKEMKYLPFFEEHMLEVFIPLKKGVWDWNTVQAVWRINQDLEKAESEQWTIDSHFMKALLEKALLS